MKKTFFLFVPVFALVILSCPNPSSPADAKVLGITVSPADSTVIRGAVQEFTAVVNVSGGASKLVTWTVKAAEGSAPMSLNTSIAPKSGEPGKAILAVAADETGTQLRVTAASGVNKSVSGSAIVYVSNGNAAVTGIWITEKPATVNRESQDPWTIKANVDVENGASKAVIWNISGLDSAGQPAALHSNTTITDSSNPGSNSIQAYLVVAGEETAAALLVKVSSRFDAAKSASVTIPIVNPADPPIVTAVTVSADGGAGVVLRGGTVRFTAQASGSGPFTQIVTWSIVSSGAQSGTGISLDGVLTVAAHEPLDSLIIRATSTHAPATPSPDARYYGETTIAVHYNDIYVIGDAVSGGAWPAAPAVPGANTGVKMSKGSGANGVYTWTGVLTQGNTFKFHDDLIQDWDTGNWFTAAVNDTAASGTQTVVLSNASGANAFKVAAITGTYTITLDTVNKKVTFISPESGGVNITWSLAADEGGALHLDNAAPFTVYKTGGVSSVTVSVSTTGYTFLWYVGKELKGTGNSITIDAADYAPGGYDLLLAAKNSSGAPWTALPVKFTVAKQ